MKLDARLQAVLDFVPEGGAVADIGTDHGYLAAALIEEGRAEHVIASDLNLGPCEAARRTVREQNLKEQIEVRQGDGLTVLAPGEVQTACIAGMGGALMADILEAAPLVVRKLFQNRRQYHAVFALCEMIALVLRVVYFFKRNILIFKSSAVLSPISRLCFLRI